MDSNLIIQYSLVALLILGALIWIAVKTLRKSNKSSCGCCSLSQVCKEKQHKSGKQDSETCSKAKSCCVPKSPGKQQHN